MIHYLALLFVLLSVHEHAFALTDGRISPDQHQNLAVIHFIVKPSDDVITATDDTDKQAIRAAFAQQAVRNATGMEMQVLRHLATGGVLLASPDSISPQQAEQYAHSIARQPGIEYAEPDRRAWPMKSNTLHNNHQRNLKTPTD